MLDIAQVSGFARNFWARRQSIDIKRILYARFFVAVMMVAIGLARFGLFRTTIQSDLLSAKQYGWLLLTLGGLLLVSHPWRNGWWARTIDGFGAVLMATMAWDVGYIGVTAVLEGLMAASLMTHCLFNHEL